MELLGGDENAVLDEADALIEHVYAFHGSPDATPTRPADVPGRPRHRVDHRDKVARLEADAAALENILASMYEERRGDLMTRLWEDVAMNQSEQREMVLRENKLLKEAMREQFALASRMSEIVSQSLDFAMASRPCLGPGSKMPDQSVDKSDLIPVLRARLDQMDAADTSSWACPRPPVGTPFWDRTSECEDLRRGLHVRNRYASFFPLKLSAVANELWGYLNERHRAVEVELENVDEKCNRLVTRIDKPYGFLESSGPGVVRRVYKADGSVQFTWASISSTATCDPSANLIAGLQVHESGYSRASRVDSSGQRSIVFFELVVLKEYKAPSDADESHWKQLKKIEEFLYRVASEDNAANWQRLENRFLDAGLSIGVRDAGSLRELRP